MFESGRLVGEPISAEAIGGFTAGLSSRHNAAARALRRAFTDRPVGFAPADLLSRIAAAEAPSGPKHFSPADPATDPTEGWNPLDACAPATPFIDPLMAARAAGYAEGVASTTHAIDAASARDQALLAGLVDQLQNGGRIDREIIAARLRQTVLTLVTRLVGEIGVSAELLAGRVEAAADLLADAAESAILRVHPTDVALVEGRVPKTIFPIGDASVARGSFVLEAASTIVEDGPALWLEQLAYAIDHVAVPGA